MNTITMKAPAISCHHCVNAIQKAVGALAGVSAVKADVDTKLVEVSFDAQKVSLATIESTMAEEGYPVAK